MEKLLLIDGNSIMNRTFYGLPLLTDAKGRYTNAVFGFINILLRTIDVEKPSHVLIAFDSKAPTFRHLEYKEYKGNRKGMPEELKEQMPLVKDVLKIMGISQYQEDGIEADDILGTLSLKFEQFGQVTVLSGDRDLLQLASDKTKVSIPRTKGGQTTTEHYDFKEFVNTYGFTPSQFIDVKGMMGDSSDNIPGIPGVGEKTAHKFIIKYQSLEGLYEHVDELPGKTKIKVAENKDLAFMSRDLATIKRDCEIPIDAEDMVLDNYLNQDTFELFKELNFTRLLSRFDFSEIEETESAKNIEYTCFTDFKEFFTKSKALAKDNQVAFYHYLEDNYKIFSIAGYIKKEYKCYVFEQDMIMNVMPFDKEILAIVKESDKTYFYDFKRFLHDFSIDEEAVPSNIDDLHLMYYLAKPNKGAYPLLDLGLAYTDITLHNLEELLGKGKKKIAFASLKEEERHNYMAQAVSIIFDSFKPVSEALLEDNVMGLYNTLERPLLKVLYSMEKEGIHVNTKVLTDLSNQLGQDIQILETSIYELAGETFNINSPKQLGHILFDVMGLPVVKKTKTGYSTNAEVLDKLKNKNPIINQILHYRQLTKLKSTYADGLFPFVMEDGKIHTTFNQTIASTGRLSSTDPNLQNIPIRLEQGRLIRKAFVPAEGNVFIDADYSQIELRVLAHISEDDTFIEAYQKNLDIHSMTASQVFHVPFDQVDSLMRRTAKAVNFGIVYGISDYGLSRDLNIPIAESREYIQTYFEKYPKVKAFLDLTVAKAYEDGFVTTMYNRKRVIPELSSSNYMQKQGGERIAMNTPIQGSAADIIKIAMVKVYNRLKKENMASKLILQVHDELIIESPLEEKDRALEVLIEEMETAVSLLVPLTVDAHTADNWYEVKG